MRRNTLRISIAVLLCAGAMLSATSASADGPTTGKFLTDCHKDLEGCRPLLSELVLDDSLPCVPTLETVLAELDQHPDWSGEPWTEGVEAAVNSICARPH